jgi:hypothetical protein
MLLICPNVEVIAACGNRQSEYTLVTIPLTRPMVGTVDVVQFQVQKGIMAERMGSVTVER